MRRKSPEPRAHSVVLKKTSSSYDINIGSLQPYAPIVSNCPFLDARYEKRLQEIRSWNDEEPPPMK